MRYSSLILMMLSLVVSGIYAQNNNLCLNPSFEKNLDHWRTTRNIEPVLFQKSSAKSYDGKYSARVKTDDFKAGIGTNSFDITEGKEYRIKFKIYVKSGRVLVSDNSNRLGDFQEIIEGTRKWEDVEIIAKASVTRKEIIKFTQHNSTHAEWYLDLMEIDEITDTAMPVITSQPQDQNVFEGDSAIFAITVKGIGPFTYQWIQNGTDSVGTDTSVFKIDSAKISQDGFTYKCIVTNSEGADTSDIANLFVNGKTGNTYTNKKWEYTLHTKNNYSNPYKDVTLKVKFTNSDSTIRFETYGFWDGDSSFKIRASFPAAGTWHWRTECSNKQDTNLNNINGIVDVQKYTGTNSLYEHGFLKLSEDKKYLLHNDGTPFFWLADTWWVAPFRAKFSEWQKMVNDRKEKGFTVIQVGIASCWSPWCNKDKHEYVFNQNGEEPFYSDDKWNPAYWKEYDKFIDYANDNGLIVLIVGVAKPNNWRMSEANTELFIRNFVGRYHGNNVLFSATFDDKYENYFNKMAGKIKDATDIHLVTQHPGTPSLSIDKNGNGSIKTNTYADKYYPHDYYDICLNQSGHHGGEEKETYYAARVWNKSLYDKNPFKPVINAEAFYSSGRYAKEASAKKYAGTDKNARQLGWISLLNGSKGYTYGAYGLWNFGYDTDTGIGVVPYDSALVYASSKEMKYMKDFFEDLEWWKLEPEPSAVKSNSSSETNKMAFSISNNGKFGVAYLPDNASVTLDMNIFDNVVNATWYNPLQASYSKGEQNVQNFGMHKFIPPQKGEWVLLLKDNSKLNKKIFNNKNLNEVIAAYNLDQNYPNPFNPSTQIKYSIPTPPQPNPYQGEGVREGLFVTLKVYDILGKEVATLVNEKQKSGSYRVTFDATNLPSGVYIYKLEAGNFISIKKMLLLK